MNANNLSKILTKLRKCEHEEITIVFRDGEHRDFPENISLRTEDGCLVIQNLGYIPTTEIIGICRKPCKICDKEEQWEKAKG